MTGRGSKLYLNSLRVRAWTKAFGWLARLFETVAGAKFTFRHDVVPREGSFRRGGEAVEANIREQKGSTLWFLVWAATKNVYLHLISASKEGKRPKRHDV